MVRNEMFKRYGPAAYTSGYEVITTIDPERQAAANLVLQLQSGRSLAEIGNITESPNLYMFNQSRLDRLGIRLPDEILGQSQFVNVPRTFYEQNRQLILSTIFVLLISVLALLIIVYQSYQRRKREAIRIRQVRGQRIEKYQNALMEWSGVNYKNLNEAFRKATEISADTLDVSRVSIWLFIEQRSAIECQDMYELDAGHSGGQELSRAHYPKYFTALDMGRSLIINDARRDLITAGFKNSYLQPNNIYSMLDIPIYFQGEVVGRRNIRLARHLGGRQLGRRRPATVLHLYCVVINPTDSPEHAAGSIPDPRKFQLGVDCALDLTDDEGNQKQQEQHDRKIFPKRDPTFGSSFRHHA